MSFLVDLLLILPIVLVMAYFGMSASLMLGAVPCGLMFFFLAFGGIVGLAMASGDSDIKFGMKFWTPYFLILGILALSFAILIPIYHLANHISWLEVLALWLVEVLFFYAFMIIPTRYYEKIKAERYREWDKNAPTAENPVVTEISQHIHPRTGKPYTIRSTRYYSPPQRAKLGWKF